MRRGEDGYGKVRCDMERIGTAGLVGLGVFRPGSQGYGVDWYGRYGNF